MSIWSGNRNRPIFNSPDYLNWNPHSSSIRISSLVFFKRKKKHTSTLDYHHINNTRHYATFVLGKTVVLKPTVRRKPLKLEVTTKQEAQFAMCMQV